MSDNLHIIHRVNLEIEAPDLQTAHQVQEKALLLLKNEILPRLERYLDSLDTGEKHFQLNQLNLDLKSIAGVNFEEEFANDAVSVFREQLDARIETAIATKDEPAERINEEQASLECFLYFLETGRLPWWSGKSGESIREDKLNLVISRWSAPEARRRLFQLFSENELAVQRLLFQYSIPFVILLISKVISERSDVNKNVEITTELLNEIRRRIESEPQLANVLSRNLEREFLQGLILKIVAGKTSISYESLRLISEELIIKALSVRARETVLQLLPTATTVKEHITVKNQPEIKKWKTEVEGIFVQHAGLVLLHPFLEYYFKDFDLLKEGNFKNFESQTLSVHLLHYLATGQENAAEYEMIFEKFLCGLDLDLPIDREVSISQVMKDEGEKMLKAAIKHWSVLKSTSPDGLREGFLQRDGKLIRDDFQDRLVIESKAQDALLSYLPWGYSIFRLPWMESALYVEWQQSL